MTESTELADAVERVREFNRGYTRLIGALDYEHRLGTPYSLPQARVLYELARYEETPLARLRGDLGMDPGQLSRLLSQAEADGLVTRRRDPGDSRRQIVRLTPAGREAAALLERRSQEATGALLDPLSDADRTRLLAALRTVSSLLGLTPRPTSFRLRPPGPGDLGWVIQRHGALYTAEYGWNEAFEALVADVVARYARHRDPAREAAWIAELAGEPVGCVFCVAEEPAGKEENGQESPTARLRLLLVEPHARGLGIGRALAEECVAFARRAGYRRVVLWTNEVLASARRIYQDLGFTLTASAPHERFGRPETGQDWELVL
ncbi:helix-turn-helix domain-containing GNAT family N-acetyltransferase [Streptomyces sp. 7-21]|uniref:bifunctional helix-turn-helix transcriptional regulator/GNAT family N-acetyltransferase n=1 Tax=Streptomyces sp. 7-21 TaxID=2802283 RepID=UPI00191EA747|nr:helix-turn-helix domain-containing GNAT family N-acetyltransferase [Streptomyces sp. 7-21]MBL1066688.1 MarR family transcriptional regulator [Streptomyces sp. 7-21]